MLLRPAKNPCWIKVATNESENYLGLFTCEYRPSDFLVEGLSHQNDTPEDEIYIVSEDVAYKAACFLDAESILDLYVATYSKGVEESVPNDLGVERRTLRGRYANCLIPVASILYNNEESSPEPDYIPRPTVTRLA